MSIRREIAAGQTLSHADEIVSFLQKKFCESTTPVYYSTEILCEDLEESRKNRRSKIFNTTDGSSKFQVMVFRPNKRFVRVSHLLCICEKCISYEYGSCDSFFEVELQELLRMIRP